MRGYRGNLERFSGFADVYDAYRPVPPPALVDLLTQLAEVPRPRLVADIGSGTGLSTFLWSDHADAVIGIEPNADMRAQAMSRLGERTNVRFEDGLASATGLKNGACDIVTISQALHWLEPQSTFDEAARILRPGGVFAAYDCDWPPTTQWEAELAYDRCAEQVDRLCVERGIERRVTRWAKSGHLERMRSSGRFRYVREVVLHHVEDGNVERLVGIARSQGSAAALLQDGLSEDEIGLTTLRETADRVLGDEPGRWFWSYRVRLGVK